MKDVRDLYRNLIVEHYKKPRNFREILNADRRAHGQNVLCGDAFTVFLKIEKDRIADIGCTGNGCAIATASASMMTEILKGKTEKEARALFQDFMNLLSGPSDSGEKVPLGDLSVFMGIRGYPARIKCATLAWQTFLAALEGDPRQVQTD
jgi:nitrogen fixation NifU-like protein